MVTSRPIDTPFPSRPDAASAFALARSWFAAGRRVDMRELAVSLGVSRATLHRWVGSRDHLLAEILWAETSLVFNTVTFTGRGGAGVADAIGSFVSTVNLSLAFRTFLQREPERALRLLTTKASVVQSRTIAQLLDLLTTETSAGRLAPPLPLPDLAYVLVRLGESFIYTDVITGEEPDAEKARAAVSALLS